MKKLVPLWMSLLFFPVIILISGLNISVEDADKAGRLISASSVMTLISAAVLYAGYGTGHLLSHGKNKSQLALIILGNIPGILLIPAVIMIFGPEFSVFSVCLAFMFILGNAVYYKTLPKCVSSGYVVTSSVLYIIIGVSVVLNFEITVEFMAFPMISMIVLWIFLQNQRAISVAMTSRNYDERYLPENIRTFNLKLTAVIGMTVLFCLLTYRMSSVFLRRLLHSIGYALGVILSGGDYSPDISDKAVIEQATGNGAVPEPSPLSGILQKICIVFCVIFMIALTVYAAKKGLFKKLIKAFIADIRRFFSGRGIKEKDQDISKGYTDSVENLADEDEGAPSKRKMRNQWKSGYAKYQKMSDTPEKFRFGYSLVMSWLGYVHPEIKKSETPYEISEKTDISEVKNFTERYYPVRYGYSDTAGEDFAAAGSALEKIKKSLR